MNKKLEFGPICLGSLSLKPVISILERDESTAILKKIGSIEIGLDSNDINNLNLSDMRPFSDNDFLSWDYKGLLNNVDFTGNQKDWNQTIVIALGKLSNEFMLKHGFKINTIFASAEGISILKDSEFFTDSKLFNNNTEKNHVKFIGYIGGDRYNIYLDETLPKNKIYGIYVEKRTDNIFSDPDKHIMNKYNTLKILNI